MSATVAAEHCAAIGGRKKKSSAHGESFSPDERRDDYEREPFRSFRRLHPGSSWETLVRMRDGGAYFAQAYASTRGSAPALSTPVSGSIAIAASEPRDHGSNTRSSWPLAVRTF